MSIFASDILDPLGMNDTAFVISPPAALRGGQRASARAQTGRLRRNRWSSSNPTRNPSPVGAGFIRPAPDYLTFIRMLLRGGSLDGVRMLRPDTVALMGQNQIGTIEAGVMKSTVPAASNDVDFFPGISLKWGFGHMINMQAVPDGRSAGSLTWGGFQHLLPIA